MTCKHKIEPSCSLCTWSIPHTKIYYSFTDEKGQPISTLGTLTNGFINLKTYKGAIARLSKFTHKPSNYVLISKSASVSWLVNLEKQALVRMVTTQERA